jgi:hypothetical protein
VRPPAGDDRRVEQHEAANEVGPLAGDQQADQPAERMTDQPGRRPTFALDEMDQLVAQARPVARHRIGRVVAELVERDHPVAGGTPMFEQQPVGAGREAVAVREDDRQTIFSPGWVIFFIGR